MNDEHGNKEEDKQRAIQNLVARYGYTQQQAEGAVEYFKLIPGAGIPPEPPGGGGGD